ncbi:hypothetical protein EDB84DRAFT_1641551 [Lactarius hengduanensis]|nr:hypothetical protein EDB84DRAFT_1641551 [Lactarius hengduanensis]
MLARLREAGMLDNSLAVCDVSGSMGDIYWQDPETQPILPAVALSMVLAQLAKPPFTNVFITFSAKPRVVTLQEGVGVAANVVAMIGGSWGSNTNLHGPPPALRSPRNLRPMLITATSSSAPNPTGDNPYMRLVSALNCTSR